MDSGILTDSGRSSLGFLFNSSTALPGLEYCEEDELKYLETNAKEIAALCASRKSMTSIQRLFLLQADQFTLAALNEKVSRDAQPYADFLKLLRKGSKPGSVEKFHKQLSYEVKETKEESIIRLLFLVFWTRVHCFIHNLTEERKLIRLTFNKKNNR